MKKLAPILSNLLKNFPCKVNLIPFNQTGETYSRSKTSRINKFAKLITSILPTKLALRISKNIIKKGMESKAW